MLTLSTGYPCHSGNFLRALRNAHEASALNLILPDQNNLELKKKTNLVTLIQVSLTKLHWWSFTLKWKANFSNKTSFLLCRNVESYKVVASVRQLNSPENDKNRSIGVTFYGSFSSFVTESVKPGSILFEMRKEVTVKPLIDHNGSVDLERNRPANTLFISTIFGMWRIMCTKNIYLSGFLL